MPPDEAVAEHERPDNSDRVTGHVLKNVVKKRVLGTTNRGGLDDAPRRKDGLREEFQDGFGTVDRAPFMKHDSLGVVAVRQSIGVTRLEQGNLFGEKRRGV